MVTTRRMRCRLVGVRHATGGGDQASTIAPSLEPTFQGRTIVALKQDFTKQVESQLAVWQGQIKDYQDRLAQAGAQAKAEYEKGLAQLKTSADDAGKLLGASARGQRGCLEGHAGGLEQDAGTAAAGLGRGAEAVPVIAAATATRTTGS